MAAERIPPIVRPSAHPPTDAPLDRAAASSGGLLPRKQGKIARLLRLASFVVVGGVIGYGFHRIVGCPTGTCPISASPYVSTLYGAVIGFLLSRP